MGFYFQLQIRRLSRSLSAFGINPVLGGLLVAACFILFSHVFFSKVSNAQLIFPALPLILIWSGRRPDKHTFLRGIFSKRKYLQIRILENTTMVLPFLIFLAVKGYYSEAAASLCVGLLELRLPWKTHASRVLPTPFSRYPYEFTVGFRKFYWLLLLLFALTGIALFTGNSTLGLFGLATAMLVSMNFYANTEPLFYVFTHAQSASRFLITKIRIALLYAAYIILPFATPLIIVFPRDVYNIILMILLGLLYIILCLLGKYSDFPDQIKLSQMLKLTLGLIFPPALLIVIPHFYRRARRRLNTYLK